MTSESPPRVVLVHHPNDGAAVEQLGERLLALGIEPWVRGWEIGAGDVIAQKLEDGIVKADGGLVVVSARAFADWERAQYEALVTRAVTYDKFVIPVVLGGPFDLPPLLATRQPVAIEDVESIANAVLRLSGRLRENERPITTARRLAESVDVELEFVRRDDEVCVRWGELEGRVQLPVDEVEPLRARLRPAGRTRDALRSRAATALDELGQRLGEAFDGPLGAALAGRLAPTLARSHARVRLRADDPTLLTIPWEAALLPDRGPLAMIENVSIVRVVEGSSAVPSIAGPLRVLVAVASPDDDLGVEHELGVIQAAMKRARAGRPRVVFIDEAESTLDAIRHQLDVEPFHVLHLACHGAPGTLLFETSEGTAIEVSAEQLARMLVEAKHPPRVVVLSACSSGTGEVDRLGVAQTLLRAGVPEVLAMQGPVGDGYATELASRFYGQLALDSEPRAARALASARREVEQARREADLQGKPFDAPEPEFATPVCFALHDEVDVALYDGTSPAQPVREPPELTGVPQLSLRPLGWVVGRRRERRELRRKLVEPGHGGALLWGVGGSGKSTMAASLASQLVREGWHVVVLVGQFSLSGLAHALARQLGRAMPELAASLGIPPQPSWRAYFDTLDDDGLLGVLCGLVERVRVLLLLDNFEDNLPPIAEAFDTQASGHASVELPFAVAEPLERLVAAARTGSVLITCRYDLAGTWARQELRELAPAPLARLIWRLPGLQRLNEQQQAALLPLLGAHPRVLEFADALVRSTHEPEAVFSDVLTRLRLLAKRRGQSAPTPNNTASPSAAVEHARELAVEDVLLEQLLGTVPDEDRRFLVAAAVFRRAVPVDAFEAVAAAVGLEWTKTRVEEAIALLGSRTLLGRAAGRTFVVHRWTAGELHRGGAPKAAHVAAARWWAKGNEVSWEDAWEAVEHWLAAGELDEASDLAERMRVAASQTSRGHEALALSERMVEALSKPSHLRAMWLGSASDHHREFGHTDQALLYLDDTVVIFKQIIEQPSSRASFLRNLSVSYNKLGDLHRDLGHTALAIAYFEQDLTIAQRLIEHEPTSTNLLGDLAISHERLGDLERKIGNTDLALRYFHDSLTIRVQLVEREPGRDDLLLNLSYSYINLGDIYRFLGHSDISFRLLNASLAIRESLVQRAPERADRLYDLSASCERLGDLYHHLGNTELALRYFVRSHSIREHLVESEPERADYMRALAISYQHLGDIHRDLDDTKLALRHFTDAISIREQQVKRDPGRADLLRELSVSYDRVGDVHRYLGCPDLALSYFKKSLFIAKQLVEREPSRADLLHDLSTSYSNVGDLHRDLGDADLAILYFSDALAITQQLVEREPDRADLLRDLSISYEQMATVQPERTVEWLGRALAIRHRAAEREPNLPAARRDLALVLVHLGSHTQDVEVLHEAYRILADLHTQGTLEAKYHDLVDALAARFAFPT